MTAQLRAWRPLANTQSQAVTTASASVLIAPAQLGTRALRLVNSGADTVFVSFTTGAATASVTTSFPMLPNSAEVMTFAVDVTHVNVIGLAASNTLYITSGEGL